MAAVQNFFKLAGKVALITGSSSGIGAATAVEFAKLGAKVAITGRNKAKLEETAAQCRQAGLKDDEVFMYIGDVMQESDLKSLVEGTVKQFGTINILVNNAGYAVGGPMSEAPAKDVQEMLDIHVKSPHALTQLVLPHLLQNKGSIVNVSSIAGLRPHDTDAAYSIAKAAMDQMSRVYSLELAPKGVRVNTVNPGVIRTNVFRDVTEDQNELSKLFDNLSVMHPVGRVGEAEEVAKAIVFLASDAVPFITGVNLPVGGGLDLTLRQPKTEWPS